MGDFLGGAGNNSAVEADDTEEVDDQEVLDGTVDGGEALDQPAGLGWDAAFATSVPEADGNDDTAQQPAIDNEQEDGDEAEEAAEDQDDIAEGEEEGVEDEEEVDE